MRTLLRVLTLASSGLLLGACATTNDPLIEARYTLNAHQTLPLAERLSITYEGAEDSRCPENARCIWSGRLAYRFTMRVGGVAQAFYLVPGQPGYMSPALRGSRIELDHMTPQPRAIAAVVPATYPVTFNVYQQ